MSIADCKLIQLPKISDSRGNLTVIENFKQIPFAIQRVFYSYNIPTFSKRGGHAHKELHQFLVSIAGGFDVLLDDGLEKKQISLEQPQFGLYIPPMVWAEETNFKTGTVILVLASDFYQEQDYYRNYDEFINIARKI